MTALVFIILIITFSLVLVWAADLTVTSISRLSRTAKISSFFISAIILAVGTSLPEFSIAITSSLAGDSSLSFGNVIGANITNVALISSVGAIVFAKVSVEGKILKRDLGMALLAALTPFVLILDREISRVDGLILLLVYGFYASSIYRARFLEIAVVGRFLRQIVVVGRSNSRDVGKLFLGMILLLVSAEFIVRFSTEIASMVGIPVFLVGLIIVSLGTTLPELAFSIRSLHDHHPTMFFGNLLGSVVANSTLVIGMASVISPIKIVAFDNYIIAFSMFILSFFLLWGFSRSKARFERREGILMLILYIAFVVVQFL